MDFAGVASGTNFKVGLSFVEEWFDTLSVHERTLTIAALSLRNSQFRTRKATPEVNEWSSNETTPTGDAEFAKISKELPKSGKRLSNRERRDNLLKFAEAMNACGMRVPPEFSSQICTPATAHKAPQHDSSTVTAVTSIPSWLRTRRLHKYEHCFQGISWAEMFKFTEADLEARGVCTLGARRRLIKSC
ncbi:hypothetical protein B0H14DRAFT_2782231 [Mycena olivaceomarginata]|nr:hypothetical protein B0H14DRAFT_2782231 [Mycena olivaceomarginata]